MDYQQRQPTTNLVKCRTDAAWNKGRKKACLAWIFNGLPNTLQRSGSTTHDFVNSPLIAEELAIRSGLCMAATMELSKLKICSDSSTLIAAINNKYQMKEIVGIVRDIQEISSGFDFIVFSHISRKDNGETYSLAKHALELSLCNI
ncbi:uncharacterized protein LOC130495874 [Raphanus sativus]|uniref:Uncharacterized protein LOC130495874 n=1 Tax=Raphanus sativus TaxID=3726 RepID=A0A9W3BVR1_RAPSA|nr:uncharacterized protein LOC130495874 [Raphanus sativus]